jgi:hypothetical protein
MAPGSHLAMRMTGTGERLIHGMLAGMIGAGAMGLVRMASRRAGFIEKTVPEHLTETMSSRAGVAPPGGSLGHEVAAHAMHEGYGLVCGSLYALLARERGAHPVRDGLALGLVVWAVSLFPLAAAVRMPRPPWRATTPENVTNLAAHLVYGVATALATQDMQHHQPRLRRNTELERRATRVG